MESLVFIILRCASISLQAILRGFLKEFTPAVRNLADTIAECSISLYKRVLSDFLPCPTKCHYVFNLRDLSKLVQGLLRANSGTLRDVNPMLRLFYHESLRTFQDRLNSSEDKASFFKLMKELCKKYFKTPVLEFDERNLISQPPSLLFCDFLNPTASEHLYEEITNISKLKDILMDYLNEYNEATSKNMKMVLFEDAIDHCCRVVRILSTARGNGLLVGLGGMGKQTVTKLASHVNRFKCLQPEPSRSYDNSAFQSDLRRAFHSAGVVGHNTTLLITDTQIVHEEFLEDINNILNCGEVPNLYDGDEMQKLLQELRTNSKDKKIAEVSSEKLYNSFIAKAKQHLHLIITMSPVGATFRRRCRLFPSLVNCCNIDWFLPWPAEALLSVAKDTLHGADKKVKSQISNICVTLHKSVGDMAVRLLTEKRRYFYSTPSNYLQMLNLFNGMLASKTEEILGIRDRFKNGLKKLYETYSVIDGMKAELVALEPLLVKKSEATAELMKHLAKEQAAADNVRHVVLAEETIAKVKAEETQALADDAQKDLAEAMPAMEAALKSLDALNKQDIGELKVFNKPPDLVKLVMEAVCLLFGTKQDWGSAKLLLGDVNFLKRLREFDKDHIKDSTLKVLKAKYIEHPDFLPDKVATQSKVCRSLCMWVRAIDVYAKVFKVVEPKRRALEIAESELSDMRGVLREKQRRLAEVEAQIAALEGDLDSAVAEKMTVEASMALTSARLGRSARLTTALGDEQARWEEEVLMYSERLANMIGDILLSAGCVAYLGPFTSDLREALLRTWIRSCQKVHLAATADFRLATILSDPYEIRTWISFGLPRDEISAENAVLVTRASRYPLMIDPQGQANRWIRSFEAAQNLQILRLGDTQLLSHLSASIRIGEPVLLEDVGEVLDPILEPVLLNQTFVKGGILTIRLGEADIEFNKNFRLYITTKLANPHYMPETCVMVTLINFTVTVFGIEEQLLADVVRLERPDLEASRTELITRINSDKQQLKNIEDKILRMLFNATGNILDDEELIDTLNESRETTEVTAARVEEAEATELRISAARNRYRPVASLGAVIYSVVSELPMIDPMYQYSLPYVTQVFCSVLENTAKVNDVEERVDNLIKEITITVYTNVARGLFERHKLVFSFLLSVSILLNNGVISKEAWEFFLRGPKSEDAPENPYGPAISKKGWIAVNYLSKHFPAFTGIEKCLTNLTITIEDLKVIINDSSDTQPSSVSEWNSKLSDFEKLLIIKNLMEEQVLAAVTEFVKVHLGRNFIESPSISLDDAYKDTSNTIPMVFVLSPGSDPFAAFQNFADKRGFSQRVFSISLGQGQGPLAEKMLTSGAQKGEWVFLQNCHLAESWMLSLERKFVSLCENVDKIHPDFRLFMSAMPFSKFPASILQNAVKVTNEPPRGLRANIKRALSDISMNFFEDSPLQGSWRRLIFGICFFHGFILERKNFGPLGWNIPYEFNDSDRTVALKNLQMFCVEFNIPWDALVYITGEITYGGRVTDPWDLRCLKTALKNFFSPQILQKGHKFSKSGIYYCPESPKCQTLSAYRNFVDKFPLTEKAEVFGMSENANTAYMVREGLALFKTILEMQPHTGQGAGGGTDAVVLKIAQSIEEKLPPIIKSSEMDSNLMTKDAQDRVQPLTTVLIQEISRFNKLLMIISVSLRDLQRGIKGEIVTSEQLEQVYLALVINKVPKMWESAAYPSLKSLGSWVRDLELRVSFMETWFNCGEPPSYWLSGFTFPQGFLTAVLQTEARKTKTPIDELNFHFTVTSNLVEEETVRTNRKNQLVHESYGNLLKVKNGVNIHGLFLEAGSWNYSSQILDEPLLKDAYCPLPVVWFCPKKEVPTVESRYVCPLYKTAGRAGTLSTTGTSTNFILPLFLPTKKEQSHWILMGTALLAQISD